jgi:cytochrome oxidase Cu insertion factor (SCO1/SenC/PrrC family)
MRRLLSFGLAAYLFMSVLPEAWAIGVGDPAPDFELDSTKGGKLKLSNLKGKTVLINFYIFDFSAT